jgi:hypothetical protein
MMTDISPREQESLAAALAAWARRASPIRLTLLAALGLAASAAALAWRPAGWIPLLGAAVAAVSLGGWGLATRALEDAPPGGGAAPVLRAVRAAWATAGVIGALAALFGLLTSVLGTWIS